MHFLTAKIGLAFVFIVVLSSCAETSSFRDPSSGYQSFISVLPPVKLIAAGFNNINSFDIFVDADQYFHLLVSGKTAGSKNPAVKYLQSLDGGETWTRPVSVNTVDVLPTVSRRGNDIQVAGRGKNIVAAWQVTGKFPGMGPKVLAFSADGGMSWSLAQTMINQPGLIDQGYMDLAMDKAGTFHLTWLDDREERGDSQGLRYAHSLDGGKTWIGQKTLVEKVCTCCWTAIATSGEQQVDVLYRAVSPRDMVIVQSPDSGHLWEQVSTVGQFGWQFVGCPHAGGALQAVEENGVKLFHSVVWTGSDESKGLYYLRSEDNGRSWTNPKKMDDPHAKLADIAAKDASSVAAIWGSPSEKGVDIFFSASVDGGMLWENPRRLTREGGVAKYPRVAATSTGYRAFWTEKGRDGQSLVTSLIVN